MDENKWENWEISSAGCHGIGSLNFSAVPSHAWPFFLNFLIDVQWVMRKFLVTAEKEIKIVEKIQLSVFFKNRLTIHSNSYKFSRNPCIKFYFHFHCSKINKKQKLQNFAL
jgi:hypothetical protein